MVANLKTKSPFSVNVRTLSPQVIRYRDSHFDLEAANPERYATVHGPLDAWINIGINQIFSKEKFMSFTEKDEWAFYFGFAKKVLRPLQAGDRISLGKFTSGEVFGDMICTKAPQVDGQLNAAHLYASAEFIFMSRMFDPILGKLF
jgi:hypothetical protein